MTLAQKNTHPMLFKRRYRSCFNCETTDEDFLYEDTIAITWKFVDKGEEDKIVVEKRKEVYVTSCIKCLPYAKGWVKKENQLKEKTGMTIADLLKKERERE
jgi:hypothetical protein